jgi:hypothetical protein
MKKPWILVIVIFAAFLVGVQVLKHFQHEQPPEPLKQDRQTIGRAVANADH